VGDPAIRERVAAVLTALAEHVAGRRREGEE
jgi:hypothetical protein